MSKRKLDKDMLKTIKGGSMLLPSSGGSNNLRSDVKEIKDTLSSLGSRIATSIGISKSKK